MIGYQVKLNLTGIFQKSKMPTWNEICQVLHELRILILEVQIELADPPTVHPRRFYLQQFLAACEATWMEIMEKYGDRSPLG